MHKAQLTISRPHYGDGREKISIQVVDVDAKTKFLDVQIDYDAFAKCLTGRSMVDCEMEVTGVENVGKKIERDTIEFKLPCERWSISDAMVKAIAKEHIPKGWESSFCFNSKDSFFEKDGIQYAKTSIHRWVDKGG